MRIAIAVPEEHVTKPVLDGALEAVTRLNQQMIEAGDAPTSKQLLDQGAIWAPEPPGDERFDHGALIQKRGKGDCDDWAPIHAATLRASGEDPGARAVVRKSGPKRWHAIVQRSDGSIDDPSLAAGMPGRDAPGVHGAWLPAMRERLHGVGGTYISTPQLALRPIADRMGQVESWQARADLPWHWQPGNTPADLAMVTLHRSPVSDQAVVGAVLGAYELGAASGYAHDEHLDRMLAVADGCNGASWEELADEYGEDHANAVSAIVGGWFGGKFLRKMGRAAKGVARGAMKLAPSALSLVPGGGIARAAFDAASPLLRKAVTRKKHLPPKQRAKAFAAELGPRAPMAAPGQWMPYPYPLPYPVPGWKG